MITIYEKMWFTVNKSRANSLAYITYYEDNKAFEKRKQTGLSVAGKDSFIFDNTPTKGFQVLGVTTRYSTDNKVFNIKDTVRDFSFQIPSGNLTALLMDTTIINGVIQDELIYGREDGQTVLIPINSQAYKKALQDKEKIANKLKYADLKCGDVFKMFNDKAEYLFLGRWKCKFELEYVLRTRKLGGYWNAKYAEYEYETLPKVVLEDSYQYYYINLEPNSWKSYQDILIGKPSHKIIEVVRNENSELDLNVLAIAGGYVGESNVGRKYENDNGIPYTGKSKLTFIEALKK